MKLLKMKNIQIIRRFLTNITNNNNNNNNLNKYKTFMKLALRHSQEAYKDKEIPIGSIIVEDSNNLVISAGKNEIETKKDIQFQSEYLTITRAKETLKTDLLSDCIIYTTLEPTPFIYNLIISSQIKGLVFGAKDLKDGAFNGLNPVSKNNQYPIEIIGGILENDSKSLLESFFRARKRESPNLKLLSYRGDSN